jgi:glyoxylase-like metal-dependent hydrolase (beta-lactamase superfamily II)
MAEVHFFTFNDFQENTYIIHDETNDCIIIDPGCNTTQERAQLKNYISEHGLKPVRLLNTHCHIDHILGNAFVADTYGLKLETHAGEIPVLESGKMIAQMYGISYDYSPDPEKLLAEGDLVTFGQTTMQVLFTPGHSPASICFYQPHERWIIAGDVLFYESIGRTDLPGGDHQTLLDSIRTQLFVLEDDVRVFPGHGPATLIGHERKFNPFL